MQLSFVQVACGGQTRELTSAHSRQARSCHRRSGRYRTLPLHPCVHFPRVCNGSKGRDTPIIVAGGNPLVRGKGGGEARHGSAEVSNHLCLLVTSCTTAVLPLLLPFACTNCVCCFLSCPLCRRKALLLLCTSCPCSSCPSASGSTRRIRTRST